MKVKVTYTVDFEDVPGLVDDLVKDCKNRLKTASEFRFDVNSLEKTVTDISKIQANLDLVSSQLDDCVNMYVGYKAANDGMDSSMPQEGIDDA